MNGGATQEGKRLVQEHQKAIQAITFLMQHRGGMIKIPPQLVAHFDRVQEGHWDAILLIGREYGVTVNELDDSIWNSVWEEEK